MTDRITGEFDTFIVKRSWIAGRPDGRKALLVETIEGRMAAFELTPETLQQMQADLAKLAAFQAPPTKPNA